MPIRPTSVWLVAGLLIAFAPRLAQAEEGVEPLSFLDRPAHPLTGMVHDSQPSPVSLAELAYDCAPEGEHEDPPAWCPEGASGWLFDKKCDLLDNVHRMCLDFKHMYTGKSLCCLGLTVAAAFPLANTHADQGIRDWYQRQVRSERTEEWSNVGNKFGEWQVTIPIYLSAWAIGSCFEDRPCFGSVGEWGERTMRAMAVGAPASGLLQIGLGASRPEEDRSHWRPFQDTNSVAGHGFVGAVPFLAAASMTRHRPLKALLFAGSFYTTWSRIDDDSHYFSQCMLGWSIAYLATQSVNQTELHMRRMLFTPVDMPQGGTGIGLLIRF